MSALSSRIGAVLRCRAGVVPMLSVGGCCGAVCATLGKLGSGETAMELGACFSEGGETFVGLEATEDGGGDPSEAAVGSGLMPLPSSRDVGAPSSNAGEAKP